MPSFNFENNTSDLHLPRLLFLHGGGVTGSIFHAQARSLLRKLRPHFRCVFADAPFLCEPHPDVIPIYANHAPFRRWLRWKHTHAEIDAESTIDELQYCLSRTMEEDDYLGATGEWVGIVGFSQGAKMAASILLEQQMREAELGVGNGVGACGVEGVHWRFGIYLAGRAPPVALDLERQGHLPCLSSAADVTDDFQFIHPVPREAKLTIPTVHVHGMLDPGLDLHRKLLKQYCLPGTTRLVEWEGAHRVPLKSIDVNRVIEAMFDTARKTGLVIDSPF